MARLSVLRAFTAFILFSSCVYVANRIAKYILKVDGGYSQWSVFTDCTKTCGGGMRMRRRKCSAPFPRFGGNNCSVLGPSAQVLACNRDPCPINGRYGEWQEYEACSVTCGGGVQIRRRKCDNPAPQYKGKNCKEMELGPDEESRACNAKKCPVNGGYTIWSDFNQCSKSCGGGIKSRERTCSNPTPEEGGKDCQELGPNKETASCNTDPCPTPTTEATTITETKKNITKVHSSTKARQLPTETTKKIIASTKTEKSAIASPSK